MKKQGQTSNKKKLEALPEKRSMQAVGELLYNRFRSGLSEGRYEKDEALADMALAAVDLIERELDAAMSQGSAPLLHLVGKDAVNATQAEAEKMLAEEHAVKEGQ